MSTEQLDFTASAARKVEALQRENESLRTELAQMRLLIHQLKTPMQPSTGSEANANVGVDSRTAVDSPAQGSNTKRGILGGRCRKERVKVAFSLMALKHAMERLRNTVGEIRSSVDSDFDDAQRMLADRRKSVEERIAWERPMVHRIHEALCELIRHGGNQKAETLQHLFSATSWGHTRMSLTQAAGDITQELHNLVGVAEQQRRAKEVLEVAALHKDRCLERSNRALIDMARTARDVVATFAGMAREVHNMAASQEGNVSNVRSLLVTRALTLPDIEGFLIAAKKSPELSTKAIEKFARHLQDSAFAATSLLSSATKAVLEPDTLSKAVSGGGGGSGDETSPSNNSSSKRRRRVTIVDDRDAEREHPGLVKRLRQRWVRSVFQRAMLRLKFKKCLQSIHDDVTLSRSAALATNAATSRTTADQPAPVPHKPATSIFFSRDAGNQPVPLKPPAAQQQQQQLAPLWSSSAKPAPTNGSSGNKMGQTQILAQQHQQSQQQQSRGGVVSLTPIAAEGQSVAAAAVPWTSEDDRRLLLHERRHKKRNEALGIAVGTDNEVKEPETEQQHQARLANSSNVVVFSGQDVRRVAVGPPSHLKPTLTMSRRALPPGGGGGSSAAQLGKLSPLTGQVEVNRVGEARPRESSTVNKLGLTSRKTVKLSSSGTTTNAGSVVAAASTTARPSILGAVQIRDALREFFVLRDV